MLSPCPAGEEALVPVALRVYQGVIKLFCFERNYDLCHAVAPQVLDLRPDGHKTPKYANAPNVYMILNSLTFLNNLLVTHHYLVNERGFWNNVSIYMLLVIYLLLEFHCPFSHFLHHQEFPHYWPGFLHLLSFSSFCRLMESCL